MAYWDTSCLLKLYTPEVDSADFEKHLLGGASIVTSEIARLGLWAALRRKEALQDLHPTGARRALAAYDSDVDTSMISVKAIDPAVVEKFEAVIEECAGRIPPLLLRTLDAIHLASAIALGESEMVATDNRLREAATVFGFSLYPSP